MDVDALAAELRDAELRAEPAPLVTRRHPAMTWADARRIALARDRLRVADGDTPIGYKLGWTSAAMREALGIERPNWGTLWASQVIDGVIDLTALIHPKLEPELVYRAGSDLAGEIDVATVAAAGSWAIGLEVVDPRWPGYDFDLLDNTADNSSCARVVVGEFRELAEPAAATVELDDGETVRAGTGANAMGDPCEAVAWLVRSLADEHRGLRAGEIVFTGGLTAPFDVSPATTYRLRADGLGVVTASS